MHPVLLLHGWGGSFASTFISHHWVEELAAEGREVVALDLPGHGPSTASTNPADYGHLAQQVRRSLQMGAVDLIGYSLGAKIALELASEDPERFPRVVAIGVGNNAFAPEPSGETLARALEEGVNDSTPLPIKALVEYSQLADSHSLALAAVLRRPANPVLKAEALRRIGPQTLLINGANDGIALPDTLLRNALEGHTYVLLSDLGHLALPGDLPVRRTAIKFLSLEDERAHGPAVALSERAGSQ